MEELSKALAEGDARKRRAATAMNERSSRAHCVFSLRLTQALAERPSQTSSDIQTSSASDVGDSETRTPSLTSRLCLVDLGGSEKLSKSRANDGAAAAGTVPWAEYYDRRRRLDEAVRINAGLLALKRCVDALHEKQRCRRENRAPPHVPYGDSKLTSLLADALGGEGKTVLLVAAAQERAHAAETTQSLRFGERCASVETRARTGADARAAALAALDERIKRTEAEIERTETWVTERVTRIDAVDGSAEVKTTTRLAGAEKPREALEAMLEERRALRTRVVAGVGSREHARRNAPAERVEDVVRGMRHLESPRGEAGATS